ncbi:hypothetical protein [Streptomyces chryseus]|uniref:hypothetical protein n=1 Tax=Streptomyces chryseus TaxID=68186 RepID=UPI001672C4D2|nr:hypothetical protein [Streptomyces chryseus]
MSRRSSVMVSSLASDQPPRQARCRRDGAQQGQLAVPLTQSEAQRVDDDEERDQYGDLTEGAGDHHQSGPCGRLTSGRRCGDVGGEQRAEQRHGGHGEEERDRQADEGGRTPTHLPEGE